jgi:hypothetical protein
MVYPVSNPKHVIRIDCDKPVILAERTHDNDLVPGFAKAVSTGKVVNAPTNESTPTAWTATLRSRLAAVRCVTWVVTAIFVSLAVIAAVIPSVLLRLPSSSGAGLDMHYGLRLDPLFSHGTVLQRAPLASRIWGHSTPGASVTVTLLELVLTTNSSEDDGSWLLELPPLEAQAAVDLAVSSLDERIDVSVDIGDVFLCSGARPAQHRLVSMRRARQT